MPELLTKYPELALEELKSAHIECGTGKPQQILVTCPKERFCTLPAGEFCIYGIKEVPQMSQIHELDIFAFPIFAIPLFAIILMAFLIGIFIGTKIKN